MSGARLWTMRRKQSLEALVLEALEAGETHGYQLAQAAPAFKFNPAEA
jgi:hypothetical protein